MKAKALLLVSILVLVLGLAACGGSGDSSSDGGSTAESTEPGSGEETEATSETAPSGEARKAEKVKIVNFTYEPDPVVVRVGGKVTWQNEDTAPHTATADDGSFNTGTMEQGKIGSVTFKTPGTYTYFCEIHPTMHGTVEVVE